jgi:hypothetical protein
VKHYPLCIQELQNEALAATLYGDSPFSTPKEVQTGKDNLFLW